jgi:tagatose 6-phosphate kinase
MILAVAPTPSIDRSVLLPGFRLGAIHRPQQVLAVAGGKGLNVARAIKRLGGQVKACALLAGFSGRWVEAQLHQEGIPSVVIWGEGETRTSISIIDPDSGQLTEVYEYGDMVSPGAWQAFEGAFAQALPEVDWVALSGRLPVGAPVDGYARLLSALKSRSIPAALDTSGEALRSGLAARPRVVKVNASEAAEIVEFEIITPDQAALAGAALRSQGTELAVITLGSRGAVAVDAAGCWFGAAPAIRALAPVGSGDAFLGGFLLAYSSGISLPEALRAGIAAGVANTLRLGQAVFDPAAVRRLQPAIQIETL